MNSVQSGRAAHMKVGAPGPEHPSPRRQVEDHSRGRCERGERSVESSRTLQRAAQGPRAHGAAQRRQSLVSRDQSGQAADMESGIGS